MKQEVYSKGGAYRKERSVILREENERGRVMVMMDLERVRPGGCVFPTIDPLPPTCKPAHLPIGQDSVLLNVFFVLVFHYLFCFRVHV